MWRIVAGISTIRGMLCVCGCTKPNRQAVSERIALETRKEWTMTLPALHYHVPPDLSEFLAQQCILGNNRINRQSQTLRPDLPSTPNPKAPRLGDSVD